MKAVGLLSISMLMAVTIISCSNSSANTDYGSHTVPSKPGNTLIVDVRTVAEWINDGHADCSVNYPVDELVDNIETIRAFEKVIVVCRSGRRANAAKVTLELHGIKEVQNKGAWQNIDCK